MSNQETKTEGHKENQKATKQTNKETTSFAKGSDTSNNFTLVARTETPLDAQSFLGCDTNKQRHKETT